MDKVVYGIFDNTSIANEVVTELNNMGLSASNISIIQREEKDSSETQPPTVEGSTTGAVAGGALGALAGLLLGVGAIALPPIGGVFIAGPIATALGISTAAASTLAGGGIGALSGGLVGALVSLGVPEDVAHDYETNIGQSHVLIAAHCETGNEDEVQEVFKRFNAQNIRIV